MNEKDKKVTKTRRLFGFVYDENDSLDEIREYFQDHDMSFEEIQKEGKEFITKLQVATRRKLALKKREEMKAQLADFVATITSQTREEVLKFIYGSQAQLSFRNYKFEEMKDDELKKIAAEIFFLQQVGTQDDEKA